MQVGWRADLQEQGVELEWKHMATSRSYYSHHDREIKDIDTF